MVSAQGVTAAEGGGGIEDGVGGAEGAVEDGDEVAGRGKHVREGWKVV